MTGDSGAHVHGAVVIVEAPGKQPVPIMVFTIECDVCGKASFVFAAHHAKTVARALRKCIESLPDEATGGESTLIPNTRTNRPENN